jgi:hypothetical protein
MPYKCCVYGCKSNYATGEKRTVFSFPAEESERQRWIQCLPNRGFVWTENKRICELHWPVNCEKRPSKSGVQIPITEPSIWNVQQSCIPKPPGKKRAENSFTMRNVIPDEIDAFEKNDKLEFTQIHGYAEKHNPKVVYMDSETEVCIASVDRDGAIRSFTVFIDKATFTCDCYWQYICVKVPFLPEDKIERFSQLDATINFLVNYTPPNVTTHQFVRRQIELLTSKKFTEADYTTAMQIRSISAAAYEVIREYVLLPSARSLRRVTSLVNNCGEEKHLTTLFKTLDQRCRSCVLAFDEVYVKAGIQFQSRRVFGEAVNSPGSVAKTVLTFMVICLFGGPKYCLKLLPVYRLDSVFLVRAIEQCCRLVENCGGQVIAAVCDYNRVNQAAFRDLATDEPWLADSPASPGRPLFLLFDSIHLGKSIRNNWLTEKTKELEFAAIETGRITVARWSSLEQIFLSENNSLFKQSSLTRAAIYPDPMERQSVQLFLQIISESTIAAVELSGDSDTALFLKYLSNFWKVTNVRAPNMDKRNRDDYAGCVHSSNAWQLQFLESFGQLAKSMSPRQGADRNRWRALTRDTSSSLYSTCKGYAALCAFLFNRGVSFVMLGLFSTWALEHQFGKFRQGCGGAYLITVRAIMEKHRIHRAHLMMQLHSTFLRDVSVAPKPAEACLCAYCSSTLISTDFVSALIVLAQDIPRAVREVLIYVSGYVDFKTGGSDNDEEADTYFQYDEHRSYFDTVNRGGLTVPPDSIVVFCYYSYVAFSILSADRAPCFNAIMRCCKAVCRTYKLVSYSRRKHVCKIMTNILLNNFSRLMTAPRAGERLMKLAKLSD